MLVDSLDPSRWRGALVIRGDQELRNELVRRSGSAPIEPPISVTELVELRPAFFRRISPVALSAERRGVMERGRELHARVEAAIAGPEFREVRVRRGGVVGQIDVFEKLPIELKTTSRLPPVESISSDRPSYLEQLGMYCALLDSAEGRLILASAPPAAPIEVAVAGVRFRDLAGLRGLMTDRAARLREALGRRDPSGLPQCPWWGRGCEFAVAGACPCTGAEPPPTATPLDFLEELRSDRNEAERLRDAISQGPVKPVPPQRFRELLYPRRAYFEYRKGLADAPTPPASIEGSFRPSETYRLLLNLLEQGNESDTQRLLPVPGFPTERVLLWRDVPVLVKTTRARPASDTDELVARFPQYVLELAWRAVSVRHTEGILLVSHERTGSWTDGLRAYRLQVTDRSGLTRLAVERSAGLVDAISASAPGTLPACPAWMFPGCPYQTACQCGVPAGDRS